MEVHWQINFKSFLGESLTIDIYDSSYTGAQPVQLTGSSDVISTRENADKDMYVPIRTQSGYLRILVENASIIAEIQPVKTTDRPVILREGNNVRWMGFIRPEQYNQPWISAKYFMEFSLISVMEAMQGVQFTQDEGYVSFFSLVRAINTYVPVDIYITAPSETPVQDVFVQNNNFREFLTIPERNERGTQNIYECVSLYTVIEAFCQYFGFSLHEFADTFYCVVYPDSAHYEDIDPEGDTQESQWGGVSLNSMEICRDDNLLNYSKVYRRIKGEFDTGKEKMEEVFGIDEFFKNFSVEGAYPTVAPRNLLFNGNAEVQPYKNGVQKTEWISEGANNWGGQIIRHPDTRLNAVHQGGASWSDMFYVYSQKSQAGSPSSAIKFNIPRYIYLNDGEYAALNINCSVGAWYDATQGEDFIKKIHCKVKVGNYWLRVVEVSGYLPRYEWTTTESSCYLLVDNGSITMEGAQYTLDYRAEAEMETIYGFAIDMPSGLAAGYHEVYFELLCNAEATADFGEYSAIGYLISGLAIRVLRGVNSVNSPTPEFECNTVIRDTNGMYQDDYTVGCTITTKRGVQYGTGCTLTESKGYVSTKYDELGVIRRAAIMNKSREVITVSVRDATQPIDSIEYNNKTYGILSQSIDWANNVNKLTIINLD